MTEPIAVSDFASSAPEQIEHFAKLLSKSAQKRELFAAIYRGKKSVKTVRELATSTQIAEKRILTIGKPLADQHLFDATKVNNLTAYKKRPTVASVKNQILRLAGNKATLDAYPTKRKIQVKSVFNVKNVLKSPTPKFITIDQVDQFIAVEAVSEIPDKLTPPRLPEAIFKKGISALLGETFLAKDWGGEANDVFTTNLKLNGRRYPAAFAFKGPATKGKLTPGKMGKNGDQIQRLFNSDALQIFFVQYEGEIDQSVVELMKALATLKGITSRKQIWWGIINKRDTYRLRLAYPAAFK